MGFSPAEVDQMSFGQFRCAAVGFSRANSTGPEAPSDAEFEAALKAANDG